jgi:hypothetical protein
MESEKPIGNGQSLQTRPEINGLTYLANGIVMTDACDPSVDQWSALFNYAAKGTDRSRWLLGDLALKFAERLGRATLTLLCNTLGLNHNTVVNCMRVAKTFMIPERVPGLSFEHHQTVCATTDDARRRALLQGAKQQGKSVRKLRAEMKAARTSLKVADLRKGESEK